MEKIKRLRSVIQSTAHHAVSGMCYLHPRLGEQCKMDGIQSITIDVINGDISPGLSQASTEIILSIRAFREKFYEIMESENIDKTFLKKASGTFLFDKHNWANYCQILVVTNNKKELKAVVSSMGELGIIIEKYS